MHVERRSVRRDAERPEEVLREHGRVPVQSGSVPEDGRAGRVQPVPGRVRAGEPVLGVRGHRMEMIDLEQDQCVCDGSDLTQSVRFCPAALLLPELPSEDTTGLRELHAGQQVQL